MSKIKEILKGIDQQQINSPCGWWETSEQAKFGKDTVIKFDDYSLQKMLELCKKRQKEYSQLVAAISKEQKHRKKRQCKDTQPNIYGA